MKTNIFLLCVALLTTNTAVADSFVVGIDDQPFLPYFAFKGGKFTGFAADLLQSFSQATHHQFTYKAIPSHHMVAALQARKIDFRYPDNPNWQDTIKMTDKQKIYYSNNVVAYTEGTMVVQNKSDIDVNQINRIGIVRGREPVSYLELLNSGKVIAKETTNLDTLIKNALLGRVDGIYYNIEVAQKRLDVMGISDKLVVNQRLPYLSDYFRLSSTQYPKIISEFNRFMQHNQDSIEKLKAKYHLK